MDSVAERSDVTIAKIIAEKKDDVRLLGANRESGKKGPQLDKKE
jgi:hypothetical protein